MHSKGPLSKTYLRMRTIPSSSMLTLKATSHVSYLQRRAFIPSGHQAPSNPFSTPFQVTGAFPGMVDSKGTSQANPFAGSNVFSQQATPLGSTPVAQSSQPQKASQTDSSVKETESSKTEGELRFTCAQCHKSFRLESALIHHMSFKHNQVIAPGSVQPTTGGASGTVDSTSPEDVKQKEMYQVDKVAGVNDFVSPYSANSEYAEKVRNQKKEAATKLPPEEVTIASHSSCINSIVLIGKMVDIQIGYVWEDRVLQFSIICPFPNPPAGESDRDVIVVRYYLGDEKEAPKREKEFRELINDGKSVCVIGNLRMNPQQEKVNSKFYYYPLVYVSPSCGSIQILE